MKTLEQLRDNYVYGANNEHSEDEAQRRHDIVIEWSRVASVITAVACSVAAWNLLESMLF